jgi:tetratricopeptide (TPR) repeat protein
MKRYIWIFLALVAVAVGLLSYSRVAWKSSKALPGQVTASSTPSTTIGGVTGTGGDFTVEEITTSPNSAKAPDLTRTINFEKDLSVEARKILSDKIAAAKINIAKNPNSYSDWLSLGAFLKSAGDYSKAREVWEYAKTLYAKDAVLYANLGNLYGYYLNDKALAETDLVKAIELEPMTATWYVRAADFYREVVLNTQKAIDVLNGGLKVLPNDPALTAALNALRE